MSNGDFGQGFLAGVVVTLILCTFLALIVRSRVEYKVYQEAVDNGAATWEVIEGSNQTYCKWKEQ